ncbi:MAG: histidine kinase dimerization/phospho-acceptor domain-containing protein, partial [Microthrixaceae bacterium]
MWFVAVASVVVALLIGLALGHRLSVPGGAEGALRDGPQTSGEEDAGAEEAPAVGQPGFGPLAEAVEQISHGIVVTDAAGSVIYRNKAARRFSVARHSRSLVEDCVQRLLAEARTGQSRSETVELFGPPAEVFLVSAHPYRDGPGTGAMAVVEDHSEIRRTETVRRDFVANISHELKTPIGALGLLGETIEGEDDPEVRRRLAQRMVSEADRAARTIDDLLELSRIEFADGIEFSMVPLRELTEEVRSRITNAAEQAE